MINLILAAVLAAAPHTAASVVIDDFAYRPAAITVNAGDTIRFINKDSEAHTVTLQGGGADSGGLDTGDSWTYTFTKPGKYTYFCSLHPYMHGTIVVRARKEPGQ